MTDWASCATCFGSTGSACGLAMGMSFGVGGGPIGNGHEFSNDFSEIHKQSDFFFLELVNRRLGNSQDSYHAAFKTNRKSDGAFHAGFLGAGFGHSGSVGLEVANLDRLPSLRRQTGHAFADGNLLNPGE